MAIIPSPTNISFTNTTAEITHNSFLESVPWSAIVVSPWRGRAATALLWTPPRRSASTFLHCRAATKRSSSFAAICVPTKTTRSVSTQTTMSSMSSPTRSANRRRDLRLPITGGWSHWKPLQYLGYEYLNTYLKKFINSYRSWSKSSSTSSAKASSSLAKVFLANFISGHFHVIGSAALKILKGQLLFFFFLFHAHFHCLVLFMKN